MKTGNDPKSFEPTRSYPSVCVVLGIRVGESWESMMQDLVSGLNSQAV